MNTREQFGKYLLLKKLTEDPMGETFRAGMLGQKGMERVALLRVFNGQGLDGQRLWESARQRDGIQQALRSPNIGEGIEMGEVQGIPYVAYDYISGKNLATLLEQAAKKQSSIPTEHALLITERIALALSAASEHRQGSERILHGFLVPHLVMISNEGETRLLGFEVSTGLRGFASSPVLRQHFGRYLAPEALSGAELHKSDDVYSLGALLFELLTGKPLPPPGPDGFGQVVDEAKTATDGSPIPSELRDLLKRSLVARAQRLGDAATWHKALNKWMFEGQYNPTTFNLAFFMHNLFRQDIERESQEIEVEKTLPVPIQPAAAPPPAEPAAAKPRTEPSGVRETTGVREGSGTFVGTAAPEEEKKSKVPILAAAAVLLLAAAGAGGWFWWSSQQGGGGESSAALSPTEPAELPPPVEPIAEEPAGPSAEEVQAKIDALINQRADEMEEQLRKHYDDQLKDLQKQLEQAEQEKKRRADQLREQRERQEEEARKKAEEEAARLQAEEEARKKAEEEAARKQAEEEAAAKLAEQTPPPPPPPPPEPQVRRGDLVEMGPGVVPPKLTRRVNARFPEMARRVGKREATVVVRVLVDENGKVIDTELTEKVGFGFDTEALQAAKKAAYEPATKKGVPVKMWIDFRVDFQG